MNIRILWNKCVDKTTDISSCIELYTKRIIKEKNKKFDKILDELFSLIENISVSDSLEKLDFVYLRKSEIDKARKKIEEIKQNIKEKEE